MLNKFLCTAKSSHSVLSWSARSLKTGPSAGGAKKSKPDYLYGINPVYASLRANRRQFQKLYLNIAEKEASTQANNPRIDKIKQLAK